MKSNLLGGDISDFASILVCGNNEVGKASEDLSAVIGKNNWCFIYRGSNDYRGGYLSEDVNQLGQRWVTLVENRHSICAKLGAEFLQLIVPNKLSILPDCFPEVLNSEVTFILQNYLTSHLSQTALIPLKEFREKSVRDAVFRRNDSHLTVGGNALLAELILEKLGFGEKKFETVVIGYTQHKGDLGGKFSPPIEEKLAAPSFSKGLLDQKNIEKVREVINPSFNGTSQVFLNRNAPIKAKLIVFGNSFFERVPSWGLSPFFASIFEEFHFIWSSDVDFKYIARERPDYVIAQTCERFMSKLPSDRYEGLVLD
ncbi:hypothetical protein [Massilia timonae]|uniref:hypothetical protein n=1 Tax=Massilia timonae TaxID=47229 RepID=UPI0028D042DD|nr:hypothetical protein [Massilia timonae]